MICSFLGGYTDWRERQGRRHGDTRQPVVVGLLRRARYGHDEWPSKSQAKACEELLSHLHAGHGGGHARPPLFWLSRRSGQLQAVGIFFGPLQHGGCDSCTAKGNPATFQTMTSTL